MTTVASPTSGTALDAVKRSPLRVSRYERASSFLVALLLLVGMTAVTLFLVWLSTVVVFVRVSTPVRMIKYPGRGDHDPGFARDPDAPGIEELEVVMEQPQVEAALEPVSNLASSVAASFDAFATDSLVSTQGKGGLGDSRPPGPLGEGDNVVPPWERWEIEYLANDLNEYARQLDFFGIELAAAGGSKQVDYAFNLSRATPSTRKGLGKDEQRVYLTWKPGSQLRQFDEQLLTKANIAVSRRIVMQFLPKKVYDKLHELEFQNTQRDPTEWLKTTFRVRKNGSDYEFYIHKQTFRPRPANARTG